MVRNAQRNNRAVPTLALADLLLSAMLYTVPTDEGMWDFAVPLSDQ